MKKIPLVIFIIPPLLILFSACTKDVGKLSIPAKPNPTAPTVDACTTHVTFSGDIKPILTTYCAINSGCHADPPPSLGVNFTTYAHFQPYGSNALQFVKDSFMPLANTAGPKRLSACEVAKLQTWVQQGSPNN